MTAGYWLNRAFNDLTRPENRAALEASLDDYLSRYPLTDEEKQLVRDGDWQGCVDAGASVYTLTKLGATIDVSLLHMGAQMRGQSFEEFIAFLKEQNAGVAKYQILPGTSGDDRG